MLIVWNNESKLRLILVDTYKGNYEMLEIWFNNGTFAKELTAGIKWFNDECVCQWSQFYLGYTAQTKGEKCPQCVCMR